MGSNHNPYEMEQIKISDNLDIETQFPMNLTVGVKVRNGRDPILLARTLTVNTFNFGMSSHDMFVMGVAFTVIGAFLIVQPIVVLIHTSRLIKSMNAQNRDSMKR